MVKAVYNVKTVKGINVEIIYHIIVLYKLEKVNRWFKKLVVDNTGDKAKQKIVETKRK